MKVFVLFALLGLAAASDFYEADDTLDIEAVVADIEQIRSFLNCYLDKGPCSEQAEGYKKVIPDALINKCTRCTDALKHLARVFVDGLKKALPEDYIVFKRHYDPENKYFDEFEKAVAAY